MYVKCNYTFCIFEDKASDVVKQFAIQYYFTNIMPVGILFIPLHDGSRINSTNSDDAIFI